ncbi:uncharacterized protein LOC135203178 [Macrobrachium nipponense]|uniref:uncharacterized protein LOC135203178 n=1 Tax=Macrobrachium nipponense TaxID=159736 RepID=UPI0030C84F5F
MAGPRSSPTNQTSTTSRLAKGDLPPFQQTPTPRPGKRRHVATVSPVTARGENRSPRAKQRPFMVHRQSPPTISAAPVTAASITAATPVPSAEGVSGSTDEARSGSVSPSQLAVPRVSAEPPCPSSLPLPPEHWMAPDEKCTSQRRHCRAVTESLLNHLTTSGILVTA